jgi:hypothetical protein
MARKLRPLAVPASPERFDVVVYGGTAAGVVAAEQARRMGRTSCRGTQGAASWRACTGAAPARKARETAACRPTTSA